MQESIGLGEGLQAINIRTVARRCNVSVGSIYYYFSGKNELALETIESVWMDIFNVDEQGATDLPFPEYVEWIFQSVRDGVNEYPNFFTAHSLGLQATRGARQEVRCSGSWRR